MKEPPQNQTPLASDTKPVPHRRPPKHFGATSQDAVTRATGRPEFVQPWMMMRMVITN